MNITKEQLEVDYLSGMSMSQLASKYGVSKMTVCRTMKKLDIQSRPPSQAMLGKKCPPEVAAKISAAHRGKKFSEEHRRKISESKKGSKNPCFGKKMVHGKRIWHFQANGQWIALRSTWEIAYAIWLDAQGIAWEYEAKTFLLSDGSVYTPDFYLVASGEFVEVKGWLRGKWLDKYEKFCQDYPDISIILADRQYLENLGIDLKQLFVSTRPKFLCEQCGCEFYRIYKTQRMCSVDCRNRYVAIHRKPRRKSAR